MHNCCVHATREKQVYTTRQLGRVVRKPISANPRLKVNREFNLFCIEVFLLFMFCED